MPLECLASNGESMRGKVLRVILALLNATHEGALGEGLWDWWNMVSFRMTAGADSSTRAYSSSSSCRRFLLLRRERGLPRSRFGWDNVCLLYHIVWQSCTSYTVDRTGYCTDALRPIAATVVDQRSTGHCRRAAARRLSVELRPRRASGTASRSSSHPTPHERRRNVAKLLTPDTPCDCRCTNVARHQRISSCHRRKRLLRTGAYGED